MEHSSAARVRAALFAAAALLIGGIFFASAWLGASVRFAGRAGWMAPLAPAIAIGLLHLTWTRPGATRARITLFATGAYLLVGEWLVACLPIAAAMGQSPVEAGGRIGADFGWMLIQLGNRPLDWFWIALALVVAARFGR